MGLTARHSANSTADQSDDDKIAVQDLRVWLNEWFIDGRVKGITAQAMQSRTARIGKLFWYLDHKGIEAVGTVELKGFFLYLQEAHTTPEGRWGHLFEPMRPISMCSYHRIAQAFFNFLMAEDIITWNPMQRVKMKTPTTEIKQPVPNADIVKLLAAARGGRDRRRDEAIILTLLDTGIRASECAGLKRGDFDEQSLTLRILGKGNKVRHVRVSPTTYKAIKASLRGIPEDNDAPLFRTKRGHFTGGGLFQLMERLSQRAGIKNPGCHALRRSFAVGMLRSGANAFTVQILMGHADLTMTRRYCRVAEADLAEQHRMHSPVDRLSR